MRDYDRTQKPVIGEDGKPLYANGHEMPVPNAYEQYMGFQAKALTLSNEMAQAGFKSIFIIDQSPIAPPHITNAKQRQSDFISSWPIRDASLICAEIAAQTARTILEDTGNILMQAAEAQAHAKAAYNASEAATQPGESVTQDA